MAVGGNKETATVQARLTIAGDLTEGFEGVRSWQPETKVRNDV